MIVGAVQPSGDAVVPIRVRGPRQEPAGIRAVVDTGFNEWVVLPGRVIESLALPFREEGRFVLADGAVAASRLFVAEVEWLGEWRRVLVVEMEGGPLVGMAMLRGCHLSIDVIDGGRVEIGPLIA